MKRLFESPSLKALITCAIAAGIGVFSGSLITEITSSTGIRWSAFYQTVSFYGLLICVGAQALYTRAQFNFDMEVTKFADRDYCMAYMRSKCLPELAAKAQERIRNGEGGEFNAAMKEIRKVLE